VPPDAQNQLAPAPLTASEVRSKNYVLNAMLCYELVQANNKANVTMRRTLTTGV